MTSHAQAVRVVASSLCFDQDPPPIASLGKARAAAGHVVDALAAAGIITLDEDGTSNGGPVMNGAAVDPDQEQLPI